MKNLRDGNSWLWAALILSVVYIVLWVAGVRFPLVRRGEMRVERTGVVQDDVSDDEDDWDDEFDQGHEIVDMAKLRPDLYDDDDDEFELPEEPQVFDDGRDPDAPLL